MSDYSAPLDDMHFVMAEIADLDGVCALPGLEESSPDLVAAILEEAGKLGRDVIAPTNRAGDRQGSVLENGVVRTPDGHKEAYARFAEGGWNGIPFEPEIGGMGLPYLVNTAVMEIWNSANMAFALCPLLTQGAIEALHAHATAADRDLYLPRMISGEWSGTMNLTEPQAGSDLGALRAKAVPEGDHYRITGQKIFITHGDQDFTDNVIHLVLARLPDAPPGSRGISLFVVPKFLVNPDGSLGERNDVRVVSLEHKLGIHASPTCVMSFGDDGGAIGHLVGEANKGLACMFTMMNTERLGVGLQGVAIAERAYQQALSYARERVQSRLLGSPDPNPVAIIHHPDVKRMLLSMRAQTQATRALAYYTATQIDRSRRHGDPEARGEAMALVELLTPVVKAWCTDVAVDVANTGIQVHGGMGFIEETGAAQYYRDARILPIYEGTNGIQANDLISRKVARDNGAAATLLVSRIRATDHDLAALAGDEAAVLRKRLREAVQALAEATDWLVASFPDDPVRCAVGAVHYLRLMGITAGGWLMARAAMAAHGRLERGEGAPEFLRGKINAARFFADHYLVEARGLKAAFTEGAAAVLASEDENF